VTFRTWHLETAVVAATLAAVAIATRSGPVEWLGSLAVLASFGHASISSRLTEREETRERPEVECYRWAARHWIAKEFLWACYFVAHHSYAALVGCAVFAVHPLWRRWYRKRWPAGRATTDPVGESSDR